MCRYILPEITLPGHTVGLSPMMRFAQSKVTHSWESGRTLLVLTGWLILGLVISIRTFKWNLE
jgi:hypothetical protein